MSFQIGSIVTVETNPAFLDSNDNPVTPSHVYLAVGPVTYDPVTGLRTGPILTVPTYTWTNPTGDPTSTIEQNLAVSIGSFLANLTPNSAGIWEWRMWGDGPIEAITFSSSFEMTDVYVGWPMPYGYCSPDDIQSRINAGSLDMTDPSSYPSPSQVIDFIREAASIIDGGLLGNGFYVPLVPRTGFTAIMPQAWLLLRTINAELATAYIEQARHGGADTNVDSAAKMHLTYAEELLQKIGVRQAITAGAGGPLTQLRASVSNITLQPSPLNLYVFGADGDFPPVPDKSKGMIFTGSPPSSLTGEVDAYGNCVPDPFTLGMNIQ